MTLKFLTLAGLLASGPIFVFSAEGEWNQNRAPAKTPFKSMTEKWRGEIKVLEEWHKEDKSMFDVKASNIPEDSAIGKVLAGADKVVVGGVTFKRLPMHPKETVPKQSFASDEEFVRVDIVSTKDFTDNSITLIVVVSQHIIEPK